MKNQTLIELLNELTLTRFYGSLEIKFECGKAVLIRKMENIKIQNRTNHENNRGDENDTERL